MADLINREDWDFVHNSAEDAEWTPGLREIFEYRDLGTKDGTNGAYVAHIVRHNGKETADEVQQWHIHECDFQFVYVLNGWAKFEYEGKGVRTIKKGDCILQKPMIKGLVGIMLFQLFKGGDVSWFFPVGAACVLISLIGSWRQYLRA